MKKLFLILAFFSASAFAQIKQDGNQLLIDLKNPKTSIGEGLAMGYIAGIADISPHICPSENVAYGQIYDVVKNYLENNPATRHEHRSILVSRALIPTFPCK
jgi:hypothetical protein